MPWRLSCFGAVNIITENSNIMHHIHCDIFRFELELKPTGEVEQYSASVSYELQREGGASVDTLTFITQTEGKYLERAPPVSASVSGPGLTRGT